MRATTEFFFIGILALLACSAGATELQNSQEGAVRQLLLQP